MHSSDCLPAPNFVKNCLKMRSCLFCKNTRIFDVYRDYGNNGHTVKDDLIEFFGYQIENHLRPSDAICNQCMNVMDNVARLKRRLLPLIFRSDLPNKEECKPVKLIFASIDFEDDIDHFLQSGTPSPNELVECKHIEPYVSTVEKKIEEDVRFQSEKRSKSATGREVERAFRRKKRGHNWSRRKSGRYSSADTTGRRSAASTYSRRSRPDTAMSSTWSIRTTNSPYPVTAEDEHETDENYNEPNTVTQSIQICCDEVILHECIEPNCLFVCENIDFMAKHKIAKHKQLALYWCSVCEKKYTSGDDLKIHNRTHLQRHPCAICKREFYEDELRDHWQEHLRKSVACVHCNKRFIDKKVCKKHEKNVHGRTEPNRVDYIKNKENENENETINLLPFKHVDNMIQGEEFMVKIMIQDVDLDLNV